MEDRIRTLLAKYLQRKCDKQEQDELFRLLNGLDPQQLDELLNGIWLEYESDQEVPEEDAQQILNAILVKPKRYSMRYIAIAASVLICVFAGTYLLLSSGKSNNIDQIADSDIKPGGNKAELTMANGKKYCLAMASGKSTSPIQTWSFNKMLRDH
ncbi:hypothetical protein [Pedobacter sp. P26]|uniref:hypothetical protein n=1 Tax=Pedobacter sp. P26 TaxID=3423956 RepID=UPI003D6749F5